MCRTASAPDQASRAVFRQAARRSAPRADAGRGRHPRAPSLSSSGSETSSRASTLSALSVARRTLFQSVLPTMNPLAPASHAFTTGGNGLSHDSVLTSCLLGNIGPVGQQQLARRRAEPTGLRGRPSRQKRRARRLAELAVALRLERDCQRNVPGNTPAASACAALDSASSRTTVAARESTPAIWSLRRDKHPAGCG